MLSAYDVSLVGGSQVLLFPKCHVCISILVPLTLVTAVGGDSEGKEKHQCTGSGQLMRENKPVLLISYSVT